MESSLGLWYDRSIKATFDIYKLLQNYLNAAIDISRLPNLYQVYYNLSGVLTVVRSTKGEIIYILIVQ